MYNRNASRAENFQDKISRLYPESELLPTLSEEARKDIDAGKRRIISRTCTFQVTDACNLRCTYCYQICKQQHFMSFDIAKKFADMLLESTVNNNEYIDVETSPGVVFEFIGGEPFLAIDLISEISDYLITRMIEMNHPWRDKFMFSICSNGVLYMDERVQKYIRKHAKYLSFSISIDGNKQLHDACRIFPDGSGSYDIAIAGVKHFKENYNGHMGSKMTMAPGNIAYIFDAVKNLIELGYDEIFLNCVYEEGWTTEHANTMYNQMKLLTDYIVDNDYFDNHYLSFFDDGMFKPMDPDDNQNWCGGTGSMISCDYKGDIYPCIRYMESSLGNDVEPLKIGNVFDGIMTTPKTRECVDCLKCITTKTQSENECFNCPIASGCSWCSAYNYQCFGTANKRATYICIMHKSRALCNLYYWNKGFKKYAPWFRMGSWIPREWALDIISEDEYNMLMDMISFGEEDIAAIKRALEEGTVPHEYIEYAKMAVDTGKPVFTNNLDPYGIDEETANEKYHDVFKYMTNFNIDAIERNTLEE